MACWYSSSEHWQQPSCVGLLETAEQCICAADLPNSVPIDQNTWYSYGFRQPYSCVTNMHMGDLCVAQHTQLADTGQLSMLEAHSHTHTSGVHKRSQRARAALITAARTHARARMRTCSAWCTSCGSVSHSGVSSAARPRKCSALFSSRHRTSASCVQEVAPNSGASRTGPSRRNASTSTWAGEVRRECASAQANT